MTDAQNIPETCDICGAYTGISWDIHMILIHPETRPKPQWTPEQAKEQEKKRAAAARKKAKK